MSYDAKFAKRIDAAAIRYSKGCKDEVIRTALKLAFLAGATNAVALSMKDKRPQKRGSA